MKKFKISRFRTRKEKYGDSPIFGVHFGLENFKNKGLSVSVGDKVIARNEKNLLLDLLILMPVIVGIVYYFRFKWIIVMCSDLKSLNIFSASKLSKHNFICIPKLKFFFF